MGEVLDTAKFLWDVVKDGAHINADKMVTVVPQGMTMMDLSDWRGPTSVSEQFEEVSMLGFNIADFTLTTEWQFNGRFIGNFHVIPEGTVDIFSSIDISIKTFEASFDSDGIVELPYEITITFRNLTGGTKQKVIRAVARGDGGGRSLA